MAIVSLAALALAVCPARAQMTHAVVAPEITYYGDDVWLGIGLADLDTQRARQLHLSSEDGVEVKQVYSGSPAERAGIKSGDVIVSFHGTAVTSVKELKRLVRETPVGRTVEVRVMRNGQPQTVSMKLGRHPHNDFMSQYFRMPAMPPIPPVPAVPRVRAFGPGFPFEFGELGSATVGVSIETMPRQLAEYFGVKQDSAVLVRSVASGSIAEQSGFKAGDVILRIDGTNVADVNDFRSALEQHRSEKTSVTVQRNGRQVTLSVPAISPKTEGAGLSVDMDDIGEALAAVRAEMAELQTPAMQQAFRRMAEEGAQTLRNANIELQQVDRELGNLKFDFEDSDPQ